MKDSWEEWLAPLVVFWIATFIDVLVTVLFGSPQSEANPLFPFFYDIFGSFSGALLGSAVVFIVGLSLVILLLWRTKFDVLALTMSIGLSVQHLIGAMTWLWGEHPLLIVQVPFFACLIVGALLDILKVDIKIGEEE